MKAISHGITYPAGFSASGVAAGIKRSFRPDLALVTSDAACNVAALLTSNRVRAAPVELVERSLESTTSGYRGVVIVSGVANALTGRHGLQDSLRLVSMTATAAGLDESSILHAATGVIGPRIPLERVEKALPLAVSSLGHGREEASLAANAILTTDTGVKESAALVRLSDGTNVHIGGMAKGSGMIAPNLSAPHATTLCFMTTDANVSSTALQAILSAEGDRTFNMVSVDGDTSTNDTILLMANGEAGGLAADDEPAFAQGVAFVMESLARAVAMDGEGATKLMTVNVSGAVDLAQAREAAKAVARSTLVKAALFGADPNVGRIACALGYSGAAFNVSELDISVRNSNRSYPLVVGGTMAPGLDNGQGERLHGILRNLDEVVLDVNLGTGPARATAWGCDLSYGYVQINAAYRT